MMFSKMVPKTFYNGIGAREAKCLSETSQIVSRFTDPPLFTKRKSHQLQK